MLANPGPGVITQPGRILENGVEPRQVGFIKPGDSRDLACRIGLYGLSKSLQNCDAFAYAIVRPTHGPSTKEFSSGRIGARFADDWTAVLHHDSRLGIRVGPYICRSQELTGGAVYQGWPIGPTSHEFVIVAMTSQ